MTCGGPLDRVALDDVGIDRPLGQERDAAELGRLALEDADEEAADDLALALGRGHALEGGDELVGGVDAADIEVELRPEPVHEAVELALAQQAVVDEDAGQAPADGLVDDEGRDERVDAAAQPADDALLAHRAADLRDLALDERGHVPVGREPGQLEEEIGQDLLAVPGVDDLGMELDAVDAAVRVLDGGRLGVGRPARDAEAGRELLQAVAVAHPDLASGP